MQTSPETAKLLTLKIKERQPQAKYTTHLARLAAFLGRQQVNPNGFGRNSGNIIEVRRSDAEIAFHLGISLAALEQCFSELLNQNVIRLRGAHEIEILNRVRLSELAAQTR